MLPPISDVTHITLAHCDAVGRGYPTHQFSVTINMVPFNALVIYMPAAVVQQPSDHAISIAAKLFGQRGDVLGQPGFVR